MRLTEFQTFLRRTFLGLPLTNYNVEMLDFQLLEIFSLLKEKYPRSFHLISI